MWVVKIKGGGEWWQSQQVVFKHRDTSRFLAGNAGSVFGQPLQGHLEVGAAAKEAAETSFVALEGFYIDSE